jgi:peptidoglycan hydrolase-like protein with peptidoglycan-binding domain
MKLKPKEIALIGIPIVIGGYLIIRQLTKGGRATTTTPTPTTPTPTPTISDFPLKKGSKGANVIRLQTALKSLNSSALPRYGVDGDFGSETEAALVAQTGKKTCTEAELKALELQASRVTTTWYPPMAPTTTTSPLPPFWTPM